MDDAPNPPVAASTRDGISLLVAQDEHLSAIYETWGRPPSWRREPGFATLVHIILEQQVSLASARAAFERLNAVVSPLTPHAFLELDDAILKRVGFSRQKARYGRALADALLEGELDLEILPNLADNEVKARLTRVTGIGNWTADIYLMTALGRPDVWPKGDLALAVAVKEVKGLAERPTPDVLEEIAEVWRPYRSSAARLLWRYYLSR